MRTLRRVVVNAKATRYCASHGVFRGIVAIFVAKPYSRGPPPLSSHTLADPGHPESDLRHHTYRLFDACGLTWVFHSRGPVNDLFASLRTVAPLFNQASSLPVGLGSFGVGGLMWSAFEGPHGSAIAIFCFPDADSGLLLDHLIFPMEKKATHVERSMVSVGGNTDARVHEIISSATVVSPWELEGMRHLRPPSNDSAPFPGLLGSALEGAGWQRLDEDLFKSVAPGSPGRTQLVFFARHSVGFFAAMSPVASSPDGTVPAPLQGLTFGSYELDVLGDLALLIAKIPAGPPSPTLDDIHATCLELAVYADRVEADLGLEDEL